MLRGGEKNAGVLQLSGCDSWEEKRDLKERTWLEIGPQGGGLALFIERCDFLFGPWSFLSFSISGS